MKLVLKALCIFCTRHERRANLQALYEKGRRSRHFASIAQKWRDRRDRLMRAI